MTTYKLRVDDTHEFELTSEDIASIDSIEKSDTKFNIIDDHSSYNVEISEINPRDKYYKVLVNKTYFNVLINNELDILIKDLGFELGSSSIVNQIDAPMPGMVLKINVKEGQDVKEDQALLILEAMKMENILSSPRDGKIKSIEVNEGAAVNKNQVLITFEEE